MISEEAPAAVYDQLYVDFAHLFDRHYKRIWYYPMFVAALKEAQRLGARRVFEVGCGTGFFAHLLFDRTDIEYAGMDFSPLAIEKARRRTGRTDCFEVADARSAETYARHSFDTVVCIEVLEHISDDLGVIGHWPKGCRCICSVPNFDDSEHVRLFKTEDEVVARYGGLIDIAGITRVARPLLRGRSFGEYLRQLRWSRDDPKKFLAHLGIRRFDNLAGWFVFSGRRR